MCVCVCVYVCARVCAYVGLILMWDTKLVYEITNAMFIQLSVTQQAAAAAAAAAAVAAAAAAAAAAREHVFWRLAQLSCK